MIFFERQKTKKVKKNEKNPGPWEAGALAGALDSPGGGTLDFFDFFHFFDFFRKTKKSIKSIIFLIFFDFFSTKRPKNEKKIQKKSIKIF